MLIDAVKLAALEREIRDLMAQVAAMQRQIARLEASK